MIYDRKLSQKTMVFLILVFLTGCASWEGKFYKTQSANVNAFADHTISMLSDSDFGMTKNKAIYVREYIDNNGKEEQEFVALTNEAEILFKGIVKYSVDLVTITETYKDELERIEAYAKRLETIKRNAEDKLALEPGHFDEILENVRNQEKFLDALRQAQPIMNAAGRYGELLLTKVDQSAKVLVRKLDAKIDENYSQIIAYQETLEEEKYNVLTALGYIYVTFKGDMQAFEKLRNSDAVITKKLIPQGDPTSEDLKILVDHLTKRLNVQHRIWEEIEPDWNNYRASHRELDGLYDDVLLSTKKSRMFMLLWLRAHQKMAAGIANPAEWFDVNETPSFLFNIGKKALL